jgi:hypothetical protein
MSKKVTLEIPVVGETIKIARKVGLKIKNTYQTRFFPIVLDVTEVIELDGERVHLKAKMTEKTGTKCRCCSHTLRDEVSQMSGIGPVCSKYIGVKQPKDKTQIEDYKQKVSQAIDKVGEFDFWITKKQITQWDGYSSVMLKFNQ